jgi:hypothetical protein
MDMVIPNTLLAECGFEMFNKQPAGYLYHVLPKFGASELFIKSLLCRSMEAGLTTEAPLCTYDFNTHILTTPRDKAQEGVLSDVRSLPFFQDVLAEKLAADSSKKNKKAYTAPEMCFQLGGARSVQTVHGANEGKHNNVPEPGVNCAQQVPRPPQPTPRMPISRLSRLLLAKMTPPPMKRKRGVMTHRHPPTIRPHHPLVLRKSNPHRPAADSPLQLLSLHHGEGEADRGVKWFVWGG